METEKIKYKSIFSKLWLDPVLSQVFSAAIIFLFGILYSLSQMVLKDISFKKAFIDTINYPLELYKIFAILVLVLVIYALIVWWKRKNKKYIGKFDIEQKIGEFTFRELYNALLTHKVELPISLRNQTTGNEGDLLTLFILFHRKLNIGIEWDMPGDQGIFAYHILGPTLMSYGLTEKAPSTNKADSLGLEIIHTSSMGYKFYSQLACWRVYNDELLEEDTSKVAILRTE